MKDTRSLGRTRRLDTAAVAVLLAGLACAALIYSGSARAPAPIGYEMGDDGVLYPVTPDDSKQYEQNLEFYGGKTNVLLDQLRRWLAGLWHGTSLAVIVACTAILVASGFFYASHFLAPPGEPPPGGPRARPAPVAHPAARPINITVAMTRRLNREAA